MNDLPEVDAVSQEGQPMRSRFPTLVEKPLHVDIDRMDEKIPALLAELSARGFRGVYEPVLLLFLAGHLELPSLITSKDVRAVQGRAALSHGSRMTLRTYVPLQQPSASGLIVDGGVLGAEVPLLLGAWSVVEADAITVYVPHGLPETVGAAAIGKRLGDVIEISGVSLLDYVIDHVETATGHTSELHSFDLLRAPSPIIAC